MNDDKVTRLRTLTGASRSSIEDVILNKMKDDTPESDTIDSEASESVYEAYGFNRSPLQGNPIVAQDRLEIRQKNDSGYFVPYSLVTLTGYIADHTITLYCTNYAIIIEGQNLTELRELLLERKAKWVQEFDGKRFNTSLKGLPEDTPVITEVKVKFGREE